jgi:uncharacterized delta-60 repeat protein
MCNLLHNLAALLNWSKKDTPSHRRADYLFLRCEPLERRLVLAAGDLDTTFNGTGRQIRSISTGLTFPSPPNNNGDLISGLARQSTGKLVASGWVTINESLRDENNQPVGVEFDRNGIPNQVAAVFRFNADGTPDTSFGANGTKYLPAPLGDPQFYWLTGVAWDVAVLPDDKILAVKSTLSGLDARLVPLRIQVARLNSNGTLDTSFGTGGYSEIVSPSFGNNSGTSFQGMSLAVNPSNGKIAVAGSLSETDPPNPNGPTRPLLIQLNSNGTLDTSFSDDGVFEFDPAVDTGRLLDVAYTPTGAIVAAGYSTGVNGAGQFQANAGAALLAIRVLSNGTLDTTFSDDGLATYATGPFVAGRSLVVEANGSVVVGGQKATTLPDGGFEPYRFVPDVIETESSSESAVVVRFTSTGQLDSGFGASGVVNIPGTTMRGAVDLVPRGVGGYYVVGHGGGLFVVTAITATGSSDSSYPTVSHTLGTFTLGVPYTALRDGDGKLVVAGFALNSGIDADGRDLALIRLQSEDLPPTDITLNPASVPENRVIGTTVGTLSTVDANSGETFTYTLVAGAGSTDNARYTISGAELRTAAALDFEATPTTSIRVRVVDRTGLSFEKALTVAVTNQNEVPSSLSLTGNSILENLPVGTQVGQFSTVDPDSGSAFTYTLVAGAGDSDNSLFSVAGAGLFSSAVFDFEAKSSYSIRVRTADQGGLLLEQSFTILVGDVNESGSGNRAPLLDTSGNLFAILGVGDLQSTEMRQGVLVSDVPARSGVANPFSDPDAGAALGIAITGIDRSLGNFQYTLVSNNPQESDWANVDASGPISNGSALLLPVTARLRFVTSRVPHHDRSAEALQGVVFLTVESVLAQGVSFRAWDQTSGVAGGRADTTVNGGSSAFSAAVETVKIYFEARLFRHFNTNAALNVYTLEAEFKSLKGQNSRAFEDRSTGAWSGFTVLLSAVPELGTTALYRMYYAVQFNADNTETDMGYRYLTNFGEASTLESRVPEPNRTKRQGGYFRELGVNGGTAILGYVFNTQQPATSELRQIYRTDAVDKPTRAGGTKEGDAPTSTRSQENGDHVYTTNFPFEATKPGTWRLESSRGFARELSPTLPVPIHQIRRVGDQEFIEVTKSATATATAAPYSVLATLTGADDPASVWSGPRLPVGGPAISASRTELRLETLVRIAASDRIDDQPQQGAVAEPEADDWERSPGTTEGSRVPIEFDFDAVFSAWPEAIGLNAI